MMVIKGTIPANTLGNNLVGDVLHLQQIDALGQHPHPQLVGIK